MTAAFVQPFLDRDNMTELDGYAGGERMPDGVLDPMML